MLVERPLVVLQPTTFCNIDCSYCYLPGRASARRMTSETIARIADDVFSAPFWSGEIAFLWHLGEPLTLPISYFDQAFARIELSAERAGRTFSHTIQTNATLLTPQWARFLSAHRVRVGVSVDGPAFIHDRVRTRRDGRGSHAATMAGVAALREVGMAFGVICVLTDYSLDWADELFAFFASLGAAQLAFNIDELEGVHRRSSLEGQRARERYGAFMRRFLQLMDEHQPGYELRELRKHLPPLLYGVAPYNMGNQPLRIVTFDCDGNFSTFCPELIAAESARFRNFVMGNIMRQSLHGIVDAPVYRAVRDEISEGLSRCKSECSYWDFCGGGDPSSKYFEHARFDATETTTCRVHTMVTVDAILEHIETKQRKVARR